MKIVVAIDSYKGSASSQELNGAAKAGILEVVPNCDIKTFEIADGGEGTILSLYHELGGELIGVETVDLLNRPITAHYLFHEDNAFIEAAEVVGIDKITPDEKTFLLSSTFGLAKLLIDAKEKGAKKIFLALGGTGTSDGGLGFLRGLGAETNDLLSFEGIDLLGLEDFSDIQLIALADVTNLYAGEEGFSKFFGKQKGGTEKIIRAQNQQAQKFVEVLKDDFKIDLQQIPGTGAAGGLGGAIALLGGKIEPGFAKIAQLLKIEDELKQADFVITGEGKMDYQTVNGKVPYAIANLAKKYGIPTVGFCGTLSEDLGEMDDLLLASFSIQRAPVSLEQAIDKEATYINLKKLTTDTLRILNYRVNSK